MMASKYLSQIKSLEPSGSDELFPWVLKKPDCCFRITIRNSEWQENIKPEYGTPSSDKPNLQKRRAWHWSSVQNQSTFEHLGKNVTMTQSPLSGVTNHPNPVSFFVMFTNLVEQVTMWIGSSEYLRNLQQYSWEEHFQRQIKWKTEHLKPTWCQQWKQLSFAASPDSSRLVKLRQRKYSEKFQVFNRHNARNVV